VCAIRNQTSACGLNDGVDSRLSGARWDRLIVAAGQHVARLPVVLGRMLASVLLGLLVKPALAKLSFTLSLAMVVFFLPLDAMRVLPLGIWSASPGHAQ
jgi:hypothetical protein